MVGSFITYSLASSPANANSALPWTLDPGGFYSNMSLYVKFYFLTIPAKELLNLILKFIGSYVLRVRKMDESGGGVKKLEVLEFHDLCYLALNTTVEFLGMNHTIAFLMSSELLEWHLRKYNIYSGPCGFILCFILNDAIYYWFHLVAHKRILYPYCHKQHHRQFVPFRGYADAANQHPLEQIYGFSIWIFSMWLVAKLIGLHVSTACVASLLWAILNVCNHLAYDTRVHLPVPCPAFPRDHNMHHRFPNCNYATLSSMMDRIFGTYKPYIHAAKPLRVSKDLPLGANGMEEKEPRDVFEGKTRPQVVPSPWSFGLTSVCLFLGLLITEVSQRRGAVPDHHEMAVFAKSAVVLFNLALVCCALDPGPEEEPKEETNKKTDEIFFKGKRQVEAMPAGFTKSWVKDKAVFSVGTETAPPQQPLYAAPSVFKLKRKQEKR
eukprot:TRINITY_DN53871_c0_g1_i1.p1 TRINITY_DN53871_c0_g1~~TRINITY_DN53871_c0_g1_i1.p1  ORF type:complete len:497 (-),score=69.78 TRINITY_DN53871_c0_g1_i1:126-1436(-)